METITLKVEGMTCMGCVNNVKGIVAPMAGVNRVDIVLDRGTVTIAYEPTQAKLEEIKSAIQDAGYDVVG